MKFETLAIHAGQEPDPNNGAVMTPVYFTSTYKQDGVGRPRQGYEYSRTMNPTRKSLQDCLAALEGGNFGLAFASGLAATDTVLRLLDSGAHVLAGNDVYGGTFRLFDKVLRRFSLDFTFADTTDPESVADALTPSTRLVWLETPTNPLMRVTDIRAVAEIVHSHPNRPLLAVDNTFATPYLQRPLELGADIVVHSMTKYLGGHSDVVGGAIVVKDKELAERLYFLQNAVGAILGPMDSFLVLRGIKTLPLRMERHAENAAAIVDFLAAHPKVEKVYYPYHESHPQHQLARRQMKNGGGMISFLVKGGHEAAVRLVESTELFALAESLGGVESLIEVPAAMTHLSVAGSQLDVDPSLVRLSVGIENVEDLLADLRQALG
ncbi:MAG: cystathionine gamma-synthase [Anaerolineaceae bacterium]|nr:cystathionine gamma-synthase [Chloroflexota bacterium]MDL1927236.1 cystathionine gamma-synthase [Anaerolineae bacterium AMX1]GJQ37669.1 MAG: cystathionine gamma-synthase [Anaerolineaceae bacterium]HPP63345.1 cystathionine gamma-synthase [Anaerolineales bacterium]NOG75263.1 cystathionine gamma-synthase [Chloroflexota bacterium]